MARAGRLDLGDQGDGAAAQVAAELRGLAGGLGGRHRLRPELRDQAAAQLALGLLAGVGDRDLGQRGEGGGAQDLVAVDREVGLVSVPGQQDDHPDGLAAGDHRLLAGDRMGRRRVGVGDPGLRVLGEAVQLLAGRGAGAEAASRKHDRHGPLGLGGGELGHSREALAFENGLEHLGAQLTQPGLLSKVAVETTVVAMREGRGRHCRPRPRARGCCLTAGCAYAGTSSPSWDCSTVSPSSPVRMRIASSTGRTKILPSPTSPVRACLRIVSTTSPLSFVFDDDLDLQLRPDVDRQGRASVGLHHALLAAGALDLADRQGRKSLVEQLGPDRLERLVADVRLDLLHLALPLPMPRWAPAGPMSRPTLQRSGTWPHRGTHPGG